MTHVEAVKALRDKFSANGLIRTLKYYRQLTAQYPNGVPEAALDEVIVTLTTPARSSATSIVNGN